MIGQAHVRKSLWSGEARTGVGDTGSDATSIARDMTGSESTRLYLPSILLFCLTGWLVGAKALALRETGALSRTIASSRAELAGPTMIGFVLIMLACERLWPAEKRKVFARGHVQDACFFLLFVTLMAPFVTMLGVASAELLLRYTPWITVPHTASWPRWILLGVTFIAMDGCNWLAHRADHRFIPLWRVHALHHSQEELSVLTTFRVHPLVHTASFLLATVPVVALLRGSIAPGLITIYLGLGALPHANVSWTFGPLGKIFVSPAYHRLHHAIDQSGDVNFGIVFVFWDVLARRAVFPGRGRTVCRTGLANRPLPVEQAPDRPETARVLIRQLLEPFRADGQRRCPT
ncbi:MAG TPA: sterol desaturase family protein [Acidimicrobiales bacterium]|nr:sterol desaturase family protein [Acidimicrobiales bacterium]